MPTTLFVPRPYQQEAILAPLQAYDFAENEGVIAVPTGGGKTSLGWEYTRRLLRNDPAARALVTVPFKDLCEQTFHVYRNTRSEEYGFFKPSEIGMVQADHNQLASRVTIATLQSLMQEDRLKAYLKWGKPRVVTIDECHRSTLTEAFLRFLEQVVGEDTLLVGASATPIGPENRSLAPIFKRMYYSISPEELILAGYLCDVEAYDIQTDFEMENVDVEEEGFTPSEKMLTRLMASDRYERAWQGWLHFSQGTRPRTLIFAQNRADCLGFQQYFQMRGEECAYVNGDTSDDERKKVYGRFESGELRVIVNYNVLSTGIDFPHIECIIIARVMNDALGRQAIGRGLRLFPGKERLLLLYLTDTHHTLSGTKTLLGRVEASGQVTSLKRRLEEEVQKQTTREEWERREPIAVTLGKIHSKSLDMFAGSGWMHDPVTKNFSKKAPGGRVVAQWALTGYETYFEYAKSGKRHKITTEPVPGAQAKRLGQAFIESRQQDADKREGRAIEALQQPISESHWNLLKQRRVPRIGKTWKEAKAGGMQERHYYPLEGLLQQHGSAIAANQQTGWKCAGPLPKAAAGRSGKKQRAR